MSIETEIDGRREGLALLLRIRSIGAYEEWAARPVSRRDLPPVVIARRPHPERADGEVLCGRLRLASARAQHVEHHLTLQCFGILQVESTEVIQLLEWFAGADLERALRATEGGPSILKPSAAVWIARQLVDAVGHAHALDIVHGALSPAHVMLQQGGTVKVDFGLSVGGTQDSTLTNYVDLRYARSEVVPGRPVPANDLYAIGSMLFELLTGAQAPTDRPPSVRDHRPECPASLDAAVRAALGYDEQPLDARTFGAMLDHAFYADLEADDAADGQHEVGVWLEQARFKLASASEYRTDTPTHGVEAPTVTRQGLFTRALMAREQPVEPQDYSPEDDATSAPTEATEAWPAARPVEGPTIAISIDGEAPMSEHRTEPLAAPTEAPMRASPSEPASVSLMPTPTPWHAVLSQVLVWTAVGFVFTSGLIIAWSWFIQRNVGE